MLIARGVNPERCTREAGLFCREAEKTGARIDIDEQAGLVKKTGLNSLLSSKDCSVLIDPLNPVFDFLVDLLQLLDVLV